MVPLGAPWKPGWRWENAWECRSPTPGTSGSPDSPPVISTLLRQKFGGKTGASVRTEGVQWDSGRTASRPDLSCPDSARVDRKPRVPRSRTYASCDNLRAATRALYKHPLGRRTCTAYLYPASQILILLNCLRGTSETRCKFVV